MRILLIGGTGTISGEVTRTLAGGGHDVTLLNRGSSHHPLPANVEMLRADIRDEAAALAALQGRAFDAVANFVAYTPEDVQRDIRLFAGRTSQYVFISSASAYQKPPAGYLVTESTPLANPYWQYSRSKIACEEALMAAYREGGFPVTIVRPSHTYSGARVPLALHGAHGCWQTLHRMRQGKSVPVHGDGTSLWTLTHSIDFAKGFAGLLGNVHALGQAVHITSDEVMTWNQIYAVLGRALGVQPRLVHIPSAALARLGTAYGYDFEGTLLGDKAHSLVFDNTKLKRLVPGYAATIRFDEGATAAVQQLLADPALQTPDAQYDRFCDAAILAMQSVGPAAPAQKEDNA